MPNWQFKHWSDRWVGPLTATQRLARRSLKNLKLAQTVQGDLAVSGGEVSVRGCLAQQPSASCVGISHDERQPTLTHPNTNILPLLKRVREAR